jgi:valyl-tRNA synthetase
MDKMAAKAMDAVRAKQLRIVPERFEKVWFNWLENIHDWCISRQLWWGHRIPVYYVRSKDGKTGFNDYKDFVVARSSEEAALLARDKYGEGVYLEQDEDVLDTWFRYRPVF